MKPDTDDLLHALARSIADKLKNPDRKQLRFNDIVRVAKLFYPRSPMAGVSELVRSCDRANHDLYVKGSPMWETLEKQYGWMLK